MSAKANSYQAPLKKFRWLMHVSTGISLLSLLLLLWTYRYCPQTSDPQPHIRVQPTVPRHCGPGRVVPHGPRVVINGTKTLPLSAYQEHRTEQSEVRVIAVVLRSEVVAYRCSLCCQNHLHVSEGVAYTHEDHFGFEYGTADIMCSIPPGCESPSHVAVTSATADYKDELVRNFLTVKNQEARRDSFRYNFTVCFSTMFEFTNVLQLVESLEMLQLLGVNRVAIYMSSGSPKTWRVLDYYTKKGLVEVIPWSLSRFMKVSRSWLPDLSPGDIHYFGQIPALNDCVYRYMYQSRYVALHDMDELILPQTVDSWLEMLPLLEQYYGADQGYMFENNVFPNTVSVPPAAAAAGVTAKRRRRRRRRCCPGWQGVPGVNILAHLYQQPVHEQNQYQNFKVIVNPRVVFSPTVHGLLRSKYGCSWVDRNIARMYHTRAPTRAELTPEQLVFDDRLLSYSTALTLTVNTVLTESGLLREDAPQ
ncbi:uncharacterized protein V6R79_010167 [Siganus canaliculatus]